MGWNQLEWARLSRQRWLDEHESAAERGDESAMSLTKHLVEEYEDFMEGLQRFQVPSNGATASSLR